MSATYKIALGIAAALVLIVIVYLTTQGGGEDGTGDGPPVADNTPDADQSPRPSLRSDDRPGPAARVTDTGRTAGPDTTATPTPPDRDDPATDTTPTPPGPNQITVGQPRSTPDGSTGADDDLMASIRALRSASTTPSATTETPDRAATTAADTAGATPGRPPGTATTTTAGTTAPATAASTTGSATANPTRPTTTESPTRPTTTRTTGTTTTRTTDTTEPTTAASTATTDTPETYTVEAGDNFFRISEKIYGSDRYWQAIAQANPLVDPARLRIGQELKLPDKAEVVEDDLDDIDAPANTVVHTVEAGENLSRIAQQYYDDPTQWNVIYNANRQRIGSNPDRLQAGMKLVIPPALPR